MLKRIENNNSRTASFEKSWGRFRVPSSTSVGDNTFCEVAFVFFSVPVVGDISFDNNPSSVIGLGEDNASLFGIGVDMNG